MGRKEKSISFPSFFSTTGSYLPSRMMERSRSTSRARPWEVSSARKANSRATRGEIPLKVSSSHLSCPSPWGAWLDTSCSSSSSPMAVKSSLPVGTGYW